MIDEPKPTPPATVPASRMCTLHDDASAVRSIQRLSKNTGLSTSLTDTWFIC